MPEYDPVAKISIVPRGAAGGLTFFAPSEERLESGLYSRSYLENQMCVALGGRIAEELIFGAENVTTGASNDFQQVGPPFCEPCRPDERCGHRTATESQCRPHERCGHRTASESQCRSHERNGHRIVWGCGVHLCCCGVGHTT
jgi:hypothetical protein